MTEQGGASLSLDIPWSNNIFEMEMERTLSFSLPSFLPSFLSFCLSLFHGSLQHFLTSVTVLLSRALVPSSGFSWHYGNRKMNRWVFQETAEVTFLKLFPFLLNKPQTGIQGVVTVVSCGQNKEPLTDNRSVLKVKISQRVLCWFEMSWKCHVIIPGVTLVWTVS